MKRKKLLISSLVFTAVMTLLITGLASADTIAPTVTKSASPVDINLAGSGGIEETTVTITVTGAGGTSTTITPMDVVFALDSSGSMTGNDPSGLRKTASISFVDKMDSTRDKAGVVSWDDNIDFTQSLTNNFPLVKSKIGLVDSSGGTNLNVGLNSAISLLDAGKQTGASWVIIFLTDGVGTYTYSGNPGSPADDAASKGYVIYSIGLGSPSSGPLIDMANATGGKYYSSPSAANLQDIFDDIYEEIVTSTIPYNVDVIEVTQSYIIDEGSFNITPDSISTDGAGITTIRWNNIGLINDGDPDLSADEIVTLTFTAKSDQYGQNLDVDGQAQVCYDDNENNFVGCVNIPQAQINVNAPPVADADGPYSINEGETVTLDASGSYDPNDAIVSYEWDLDNDGVYDDATGVTASNTYGDDGTFTVGLRVTDGHGLTDDTTAEVVVHNLDPTATLDISGAISFPGGEAFLGRKGVEQMHEETATDPGSDDLTFDWSFGPTSTYYNDGVGPDPDLSPDGTYPFGASDSANVTFGAPGVHSIDVLVTDDDGGSDADPDVGGFPKIITDDGDCTRSQGFWKQQFGEKGKHHFDDATRNLYLDIVDFASGVFSEEVFADTIENAREVMKASGPEMRDKAEAQLLAAWLNFAYGAVGWDELIDTDGDGIGDTSFHAVVLEAETILLDMDATHEQLVHAKDLAEAVNLLDADNPLCDG